MSRADVEALFAPTKRNAAAGRDGADAGLRKAADMTADPWHRSYWRHPRTSREAFGSEFEPLRRSVSFVPCMGSGCVVCAIAAAAALALLAIF